MCTQACTRTFVEPLRRYPDRSCGRTSSLHTPAKHLHAVGHLFGGERVHGMTAARAAQVCQAGSGDHAARWFVRMVDGWKYLPGRLSVVDRIVVEEVVRGSLEYRLAQRLIGCNRVLRQFVDRVTVRYEAQARFFDHRNTAD